MIQELKNVLKTKKSHWSQWSLEERETHREEAYLIQSSKGVDLDQSRSVSQKEVELEVWVSKSNGRQGRFKQNISREDNMEEKVDLILEKAHLSSEQTWQFPKNAYHIESRRAYFLGFEDNLQEASVQLGADLKSAIEMEKQGEFNSAELFVSKEKSDLELSTGFVGTHQRSKIYSEVCFSASRGENSNEFLVTRVGAHPEQMEFSELCRTSASGAAALLDATEVDSGKYSCLVDCEVLGQILSDAITRIESDQLYYGMPFAEKGSSFIKDFKGDSFTLSLNPDLDFALGSKSFSFESLKQNAIDIISENRVLTNLTSSRMAQYLDREPTSTLGNIVLKSNSTAAKQELLDGDRTLEILQFSGLFSDPQDLSFSSEIRLARLWKNGKPEGYIKGGNFSGKFTENATAIRFCKDSVFRNLNEEALEYPRAYIGPGFALLNDVVVSS